MFRRFLVLAVLLVLAVIFFSACTKKDTDVIKIGIAGPMTGDQSRYGADFSNGTELALKHWMEKGGVAGHKIDIVKEDDQHDPKQAVSIANKLVNEGVAGVIGHFNSNCSIPASKVYMEGSVVEITPSTTNPKYSEQGYWNVFRVCGRDDQQGNVAADFVRNKLKAARVAIVHDKTVYGQGITDVFKSNLGDKAHVVYYGSIIQGDKDFKSVLTTIKGSNPDVVYFGGMYPEGGLLLKQAREVGLNAIFVSGDGAMDAKLIEIAGKDAEGAYMTFTPDPSSIESAKAFIDEYTKKYGEPGPYSIYAYTAANIMFQAINDTGTTDSRKVAEYIRTHSFDSPLGKVEFSPNGDNKNAHYVIWQVKGGKFVQVTD